ncbi:MAG: Ig-like domain-containing protein [Polyangiaceae bacterium]
MPTNAAIELRFDRFLLPSSGLDAGLALYAGNPPANRVGLDTEYDLIERVVVLRPTRALQPNTLYVAEIPISSNPKRGFWALDGAPLAAGAVPFRFSFSTGSGPSSQQPTAAPPSPDTCDTLTQGALSTCAGCHASTPADASGAAQFPPMGLDLSSSRGLYYTAIGRVAHQTETANSIANTGLRTPARFGVQMNIVDPGNPATSYLMYKLLQKPENFRLGSDEAACPTAYHSPVAEGSCTPPSADEVAQLREWFVHGDPMPKNGRSADGSVLSASTDHANLVRIARWIASGAVCAEPGAQ